ncbi:unnamed protein product [Chironomus riparius]|uniref:Uncharacterized protein n=1 Tax=Chironomus riparius TaxID=315576 RepID=A0A9N9WTQ5_9DIPT|nr:unnamed protein product [Chironomus riparius]
MLDNEEPWMPPRMQAISQAPKVLPQVPELTIISTENKQNGNKTNFLQRAILTEKNLKPQSSHNDPVRFQPQIGTKDNRFGENSYKKSPTNILKEDNKAYQPMNSKPQVPDVTILDDDKQTQSPSSTERVFTNSYKEMMINSHNQFLKQFTKEQNVNTAPKYPETARYKQNPLTKYIPSPEAQSYKPYKDGNSSSILTDIDITQGNNNIGSKKDETEEVTFKKVAEMLSEIQKLVIPEQSLQSPNSRQKSNNYEILKQLANNYLSQEELMKYQVDSELSELEKCQML